MTSYRERVEELYCSTQFLPAYRAGFAEAREGAERIAAEADARIAELEAALPDPEMLETIATTRGQLSYDARDALLAAAERIRLALAAPDAGAGAGGAK